MSDLRFALRLFFRQRSFSAAAALTLAIGIAAPTAVFSVVETVLLRPLPVHDPERLVAVQIVREDARLESAFSVAEYIDYRDRTRDVMTLAAHNVADMTLRTEGAPQVDIGLYVSGNYFDVLGIRPGAGRFFAADEGRPFDPPPVAVISHDVWARILDADPRAVGRTIHVNGQPLTIIGVTAEGFHGTLLGARPGVWIPLGLRERLQPEADIGTRGRAEWLRLFARLGNGVAVRAAESRIAIVARQPETAAHEYRRGAAPRGARLTRFTGLTPAMQAGATRFLGLLQSAALLVLLIAVINVGGMLLARASGRSREFGIRKAIGANRLRLARQMLGEGAVLATAGGVGGLLLASWLIEWLRSIRPPLAGSFELPIAIDAGVLGFAVAVMAVTALALGAFPLLQRTPDIVAAIRGGAGPAGRRRIRGTFVVVQLALSLVLLVSSGLLVRTLQTALAIDHGFRPDGVLALELNLRLNGYDGNRARGFYASLLERLRAAPEVESAALASLVPLGLPWDQTRVHVSGIEPPEPEGFTVGVNMVSAGYFETVRMPILAGRAFTETEQNSGRPVAIVNESFARRFWPGGSAVGERVRLGARETEIVGVVPDGKYRSLTEEQRLHAYVPIGPPQDASLWLHVRGRNDAASLATAVRRVMGTLDPDVAPVSIDTMARLMESRLFLQRLGAQVVGGFGVTALLLAAVGLFGVLSFTVSQRTREIGVRIALGAAPRQAALLVIRQGLALVLGGVALGLALAIPAGGAMRALLEDISPYDPVTLAAVGAMFVGAGLGAAWIPTRRATRIDPGAALRAE